MEKKLNSVEKLQVDEMPLHRVGAAAKNLTGEPDKPELVYPTHDYTVVVYSVILIFGVLSNLYIFVRYLKADKSYHTKARLRLFHIVISNLLICVFAIPFEIGWRTTIEWKAGDAGCKAFQFFRVLGLYALANNLTAVALDKLVDVRMLMKMGSGAPQGSPTRGLFGAAWVLSAVCSFPQVLVFQQDYAHAYSSVMQCEAEVSALLGHEHIYNVFMLSFMFLIPSIVMLTCYAVIFHNIKSTKDLPEDLEYYALASSAETSLDTQSRPRVFSVGNQSRASAGGWSSTVLSISNVSASNGDLSLDLHLRSNDGAYIVLDEGFDRDLRIFFTATIIFIVTSLPYICFALWYLIDDVSHAKVHPIIQELPFVLVFTNTLLIPAVHGLSIFAVWVLYALANNLTAGALDTLVDVRMLMEMGSEASQGSSTRGLSVSAVCSFLQALVFQQDYAYAYSSVIQCEAKVAALLGHEHICNGFMLSFMFPFPSIVMLTCYAVMFHNIKSTKV